MAIYERMTEEMLYDADKQMIEQWNEPNNNFRKAIHRLEDLKAQGRDPVIFHVTLSEVKGGIMLVNRPATKYKKVNA